MATAVFVHAHPDDEAIATGGTMAKAAAAGHRVVLVVATRGEHGEVRDDFLRPGEELWERRVEEVHEAARILGVSRVEFLGYVDSGMMGTAENDAPGAFWRADVEEAAQRLAQILSEESAEVVTVYDDYGVYGHPDHIQVHRVGIRAASLAGTPSVLESTLDRDLLRRVIRNAGAAVEAEPPVDDSDLKLGVPGHRITTRVDVRGYLDTKRAAMAAHASQIDEQSFFLTLPPPVFELAFGTEAYIRRGAPAGTTEDDVFATADRA